LFKVSSDKKYLEYSYKEKTNLFGNLKRSRHDLSKVEAIHYGALSSTFSSLKDSLHETIRRKKEYKRRYPKA